MTQQMRDAFHFTSLFNSFLDKRAKKTPKDIVGDGFTVNQTVGICHERRMSPGAGKLFPGATGGTHGAEEL